MDLILAKLESVGIDVDASTRNRLAELDAAGHLSWGWPGRASTQHQDFLAWFNVSIPERTTTSIVSSRLGRKLDMKDDVFRILRTALAQLDPERQLVLSVAGTSTHRFVSRACELFGVPLLRVSVSPEKQGLRQWMEALFNEETHHPGVGDRCFVFGPLGKAPGIPLQDRIQVLESDQLLVLHVRKSGNLDQLLRHRLRSRATPRVYLAVGDEQLVPKLLAESMMDGGAVGWFVDTRNTHGPFPLTSNTLTRSATVLEHIDPSQAYLTHCTRRATGPWPDQPEEEYLDQLILGEPAKDRSSLAALIRIVRQQRLVGTSESIRWPAPTVSFTAAPISELSGMHRFRSHRGRWDFEPYGISIESDALRELGATPVVYGDESTWEGLDASQRPYFQKVGNDANSIDWKVEQEWRVLGDVDLSVIPPNQAIIFVPSLSEAQHLATLSRWPIHVIDRKAGQV